MELPWIWDVLTLMWRHCNVFQNTCPTMCSWCSYCDYLTPECAKYSRRFCISYLLSLDLIWKRVQLIATQKFITYFGLVMQQVVCLVAYIPYPRQGCHWLEVTALQANESCQASFHIYHSHTIHIKQCHKNVHEKKHLEITHLKSYIRVHSVELLLFKIVLKRCTG